MRKICWHETWYMPKICSHEACTISRFGKIAFLAFENANNFHTLCEVSWNLGFSNWQISNFQATKFRKMKLGTRGKLAHTKVGTLKTWISQLGKITFSGRKNEENFLSLRGTLKRWFNESAAIVFSNCQNTDNLFTRSLVTLKRGFHDSGKSHFPASKMTKISTLCEVSCNDGYSNWQKSHFQADKMRKVCSQEACNMRKICSHKAWDPLTWMSSVGKKEFLCLKCKIISVLFPWYLQTLVSRISRNRVFRLPKFGKFAHKKLDTRGKFAHTKLGTFETRISRLGKIAFSGYLNAEN